MDGTRSENPLLPFDPVPQVKFEERIKSVEKCKSCGTKFQKELDVLDGIPKVTMVEAHELTLCCQCYSHRCYATNKRRWSKAVKVQRPVEHAEREEMATQGESFYQLNEIE